MGIFSICRPEDYHLWYSSVKQGLPVVLTMSVLASWVLLI